jgi:hypothetical protein
MKNLRPIAVLIVLTGLITVLLTACPKRIETSEPGRGGLPRGIVETEQPPSEALIADVRDYYIDLLGIQPEIRDENREVFTFVTDDYTLVLIPMPGTPSGGTEIDFELPEE